MPLLSWQVSPALHWQPAAQFSPEAPCVLVQLAAEARQHSALGLQVSPVNER